MKKKRDFKRKILKQQKNLEAALCFYKFKSELFEFKNKKLKQRLNDYIEFVKNPYIEYWFDVDYMNNGDILRCRLKAPERIFDFGSRTFIDKKAPDSFRKMIFADIKREFAYKLTERILFKEIEQFHL